MTYTTQDQILHEVQHLCALNEVPLSKLWLLGGCASVAMGKRSVVKELTLFVPRAYSDAADLAQGRFLLPTFGHTHFFLSTGKKGERSPLRYTTVSDDFDEEIADPLELDCGLYVAPRALQLSFKTALLKVRTRSFNKKLVDRQDIDFFYSWK